MSVQDALRSATTDTSSAHDDLDVGYSPHGVVTEIVLRGSLDLGEVAQLERALGRARMSGARMIMVDLRELESIDQAAWAALELADALCFDSNIRLRVLRGGQGGPEPLSRR